MTGLKPFRQTFTLKYTRVDTKYPFTHKRKPEKATDGQPYILSLAMRTGVASKACSSQDFEPETFFPLLLTGTLASVPPKPVWLYQRALWLYHLWGLSVTHILSDVNVKTINYQKGSKYLYYTTGLCYQKKPTFLGDEENSKSKWAD